MGGGGEGGKEIGGGPGALAMGHVGQTNLGLV